MVSVNPCTGLIQDGDRQEKVSYDRVVEAPDCAIALGQKIVSEPLKDRTSQSSEENKSNSNSTARDSLKEDAKGA